MCRLYANSMPFYVRGLEHPWILVSSAGTGTSPPTYRGTTVIASRSDSELAPESRTGEGSDVF